MHDCFVVGPGFANEEMRNQYDEGIVEKELLI
jgi:hypothetical protein